MRELCTRCLRPLSACYCAYTKPVDTGVKFVFLMHPKEAKRQRTGTGRLASLCLPNSEILVGVDFSENERLNSLLKDESYAPFLLYPSSSAVTVFDESFKKTAKEKTILVLLIDSTWSCSKKILKLSKNLHSIPALSFSGAYKSIFTFKKEPAEYCVSTIESCYYLINELKSACLVDSDCSAEPLMNVFKKMIQFQLQKENERIENGGVGTHAYDWKYNKKREIPDF